MPIVRENLTILPGSRKQSLIASDIRVLLGKPSSPYLHQEYRSPESSMFAHMFRASARQHDS
jgi:hypothetical protein